MIYNISHMVYNRLSINGSTVVQSDGIGKEPHWLRLVGFFFAFWADIIQTNVLISREVSNMLPDSERKLLRILINYPSPLHKSRMPDFKRLEVMTGRGRPDIQRGLQYLEDQGFILWPDKSVTDGIQIIRTEELEKSPSRKGNIDYWTKY